MKLSTAAEFAVRGILVVADEYERGRPVTLDRICARRDLPKQYLVKIFSSLTKADLITPVRGKKGGYLLSRPPDAISVLEVIEAVEGPITLNLCQYEVPRCDLTDCPLRPVWAKLQRIMRRELGAVSLTDCLQCDFFRKKRPR